MLRRASLVPLFLTLLLGLLGVPPASAQDSSVLYGAIDGTDGRAVNALIGFDFLDAQGRRLRRDGCLQSPECPLVGYASVLRVNQTLPAEGSTDRAAHRTDWTMEMPAGTAQVFIEAYPQNASFRTDEARYGHAMRHSVKVPTGGPVDLRLPLVLCGEGGTVGSISGTAVKAGAPHPVRRVVAWSLDAYDPATRPVLGWNIGTARADGTFVLPNLPAEQRYQVWVTDTEGAVTKTFGVTPPVCADLPLVVSFDPPPPPCGTAAPSPAATATATTAPCTGPTPAPAAPVPPSAPTIDAGQDVITTGGSSTLTGVAEPGETVELWAYSRPASEFRRVRTAQAMPTGLYTFTVSPPTDTRLRVRVDGLDSPSVVIGVRTAVQVGAVRTGPRAYRFSGTVSPGRAGVRVDVLARTSSGLRLLTSARTGAGGRWSVDRRFAGTARLDVVARSAPDGVNRSGSSTALRVVVR